MGLALFGANLLFAQLPPDTITMIGEVVQIDLVDSTTISEGNISLSIDDLVQKKAGANLVCRGNYAKEPQLRVYKNEQVNITLNGMRMYGACTDRMDPITSYAETANLESITLTHSGHADVSGNALGGSLNLQLKSAGFSGTPKTNGLLGGSYASNTNGGNFLSQLNHQNKNWGVLLQAAGRKHGNYSAGGGEEVEFSQYQKVNTTASLAFRLNQKEVLRVNLLYDLATDVGYPSLPMDVGKAEAMAGSILYQNYTNSKYINMWESMVYYNSIYHVMDDTKRPDVSIHMDMPGWSKTIGAWIKVNSNTFGNHTLNGMLEYYQNFRRAEMTMYPENEATMFMLTWPDVMRNTIGFGVIDVWNFNPKWSLTSSFRLDLNYSHITTELGKKHMEVFGYDVEEGALDPIVSLKENLNYYLSKHITLYTNLAYVERVPDISEYYGFYLYNAHDGFDYIGNPELKKEQAWQSEVGIAQQFNRISWNLGVYYHRINNYIIGRTDPDIDPMTIGANGVRVYSQMPYANVVGFETGFHYKLSSALATGLNAQYTRGEENTKEPLPLIAPLKGNLYLNYVIKNWYCSADLTWATVQNRVNSNYGDLPTSSYVLFNVAVGKNWKLGKKTLKTEVKGDNLFDVYYRDHLSWAQVPLPGRNIVFNLLLQL